MAKDEIEILIGSENLKKLTEKFGGTYIYIPKESITENRNEQIKQEFDFLLSAGSTCMNAYQALSSNFCVSPRRIMQIVNE